MGKLHYKGPVVLAILDGVGLAPAGPGNAVAQARLDFLNMAAQKYLSLSLQASGEAVGVLPGQMGNSEVGHNALGSGQIIRQQVARIEYAFSSGEIWQSEAWQKALTQVLGRPPAEIKPEAATDTGTQATTPAPAEPENTTAESDNTTAKPTSVTQANFRTLHFAGIFSDGGVHSDIRHLEKMIERAYQQGVRRIRVHCVYDGRDVPPQSEPKFTQRLERFMAAFADADFKIADGAGRMVATADRYENDWPMVQRGWELMVRGESERHFTSAEEAIQTLRAADPTVQDQYLPDFVVVDAAGQPVGPVRQGDAFIYYDFRADRAIEIAQAFTYHDFPYFERGEIWPEVVNASGETRGEPKPASEAIQVGDLFFAGLTEYNANTHVPQYRLVQPVEIHDTLNQFLSTQGKTQLDVSETVKYGHVTYYFNGNSYDPAPGESAIEIPSDTRPFDTRPWMKSAEITDAALELLGEFDFVRLNYPGGDMVGHFAELQPTVIALEAIDLELRRLAEKVDALGGILVIVADHGNAEELIDPATGKPKTSHTTNPVPCIFYDNTENRTHYRAAQLPQAGIANLAATLADLLGLETKPASWEPSLLELQ